MCCIPSCKTIFICSIIAAIVFFVGTGFLFAWLKSVSHQAMTNSDAAKAYHTVKDWISATPIKRVLPEDKTVWEKITQENVFYLIDYLQSEDSEKNK